MELQAARGGDVLVTACLFPLLDASHVTVMHWVAASGSLSSPGCRPHACSGV